MRIDQNSNFGMHICMDWRAVKFDWNKAHAFLVTAEEGSLSAAARLGHGPADAGAAS